MKNLTLSQQYALISLDGLESLHPSLAKSAVIRAIAAAQILEEFLCDETEPSPAAFTAKVEEAVAAAKKLKKNDEKVLEQHISFVLEEKGLLTKVPNLLGCDMDYDTSGIELKSYCSEEVNCLRIREGLRAEILEDGALTMDCVVLLWLLRESGCMHDLFSVTEQAKVQEHMTDAASVNECYRILWQAEFHSIFESFAGRFLKTKQNLFCNPYLEGVNLVFPFLERRKSIFIDCIIFGTNVKERRTETIHFLKEKGYAVEEIPFENETLLKIGHSYYRIFPMIKRSYKVPIQGVNLVPVYW
nr:hypothetical protein [uncultured Mediterraneibacter sp.]